MFYFAIYTIWSSVKKKKKVKIKNNKKTITFILLINPLMMSDYYD